jgi:hypothetical protein
MKIEKSSGAAGMWSASCWIGNEYFVGCSEIKVEALNRLFEKIYWKFNLK